MAAGEGTRLRPLTETWPKPVLPIDGRPVIATLLRELAAAGVERVTVVSGHLAEVLEELVGDGGGFGLRVDYVRQLRADGRLSGTPRMVAYVTPQGTGYLGAPIEIARSRDTESASRCAPPSISDQPCVCLSNSRSSSRTCASLELRHGM